MNSVQGGLGGFWGEHSFYLDGDLERHLSDVAKRGIESPLCQVFLRYHFSNRLRDKSPQRNRRDQWKMQKQKAEAQRGKHNKLSSD
jgi:hypothetical protein